MTAKTMAEVLSEHRYLCGKSFGANRVEQCSCGWQTAPDTEQHAWESLAAHQATALSAAGFGMVTDAKAEALEEAADDFESNVGVGEFAELSTRDSNPWGHIEESWEHQGPYMDWLRNRAAVLRGDS